MKGNKGITLVALVVTIIILLILAAVSINLVIGENGIINRSKDASIEYRAGRVEEGRDHWFYELSMDEYLSGTSRSLDDVLNDLKKEGALTDQEAQIVKSKGKVTIGSKTIIFDYDLVSNDPTQEYPEITIWIPIYTKAQLQKVGSGESIVIGEDGGSEYTFSYGSNIGYILQNDIDLTGENFTAIPDLTAGVFLGNNKTISNLLIENKQFTCLFERNRGTIANLNVTGKVSSDGAADEVAGIVATNDGDIKNCSFNGIVEGNIEQSYVGGIVRKNNGKISNCKISGEIKVKTDSSFGIIVGGITASSNQGIIENCENNADIILDSGYFNTILGGIAGVSSGTSATIKNCKNTGKIEIKTGSPELTAGGIAGNFSGNIEGCYNAGEVSVVAQYSAISGGIAADGNGQIANCYNTGKVTAKEESGAPFDSFVAGIVGRGRGKVENSYNVGTVVSTGDVTAIHGSDINAYGKKASVEIVNSYYLIDSFGDTYAATKTSEELKGLAVTLGSAWKADTSNVNNGYPILLWQ